jgi:hypothetical protein
VLFGITEAGRVCESVSHQDLKLRLDGVTGDFKWHGILGMCVCRTEHGKCMLGERGSFLGASILDSMLLNFFDKIGDEIQFI